MLQSTSPSKTCTPTSQSENVTVLNITHHPSLKPRWVERMLGRTIGSQQRHQVARALYRPRTEPLGQAIVIETDMEVTPKKASLLLARTRDNTSSFPNGIRASRLMRKVATPHPRAPRSHHRQTHRVPDCIRCLFRMWRKHDCICQTRTHWRRHQQ